MPVDDLFAYAKQLLEQIDGLPEQLRAAELLVIELQQKHREAQDALKTRESELLLGQDPQVQINGKNAETREAQLTQATAHLRTAVRDAEAALAKASAELSYLKHCHRATLQSAQLVTALLAQSSDNPALVASCSCCGQAPVSTTLS